jgi:hypothetical protein
MAHEITDNRNEKLIDHVESILVFPLSLILSLKGHLDSRLRGNGIREGRPVGSPLRDAVPLRWTWGQTRASVLPRLWRPLLDFTTSFSFCNSRPPFFSANSAPSAILRLMSPVFRLLSPPHPPATFSP